jgi:hypothetical protein
MHEVFAVAGDDFALREALREVIACRNRVRRRRAAGVMCALVGLKRCGVVSSRDDINGRRSGFACH